MKEGQTYLLSFLQQQLFNLLLRGNAEVGVRVLVGIHHLIHVLEERSWGVGR